VSTNSNAESWRLDKRISVADIVAVMGSLAMVMVSYFTLSTRLAVVESKQDAQAKQRSEDMSEIRSSIEYIRRAVEDLRQVRK